MPDPQRISSPPKVAPISTSVQQFDAAAKTLRVARPSAQRATYGDALGRVKYTLPIERRGPPGDRDMKAWLSALAQSDAKLGTP
jgi:hypothetical protein